MAGGDPGSVLEQGWKSFSHLPGPGVFESLTRQPANGGGVCGSYCFLFWVQEVFFGNPRTRRGVWLV